MRDAASWNRSETCWSASPSFLAVENEDWKIPDDLCDLRPPPTQELIDWLMFSMTDFSAKRHISDNAIARSTRLESIASDSSCSSSLSRQVSIFSDVASWSTDSTLRLSRCIEACVILTGSSVASSSSVPTSCSIGASISIFGSSPPAIISSVAASHRAKRRQEPCTASFTMAKSTPLRSDTTTPPVKMLLTVSSTIWRPSERATLAFCTSSTMFAVCSTPSSASTTPSSCSNIASTANGTRQSCMTRSRSERNFCATRRLTMDSVTSTACSTRPEANSASTPTSGKASPDANSRTVRNKCVIAPDTSPYAASPSSSSAAASSSSSSPSSGSSNID
mmetsp:Transcript_2213/g.3002  ORF Transcript_2213/g.3002 Transcript_2213/m.3002 type:complete len:336 (-) Transcript_2213:188-1195(-)